MGDELIPVSFNQRLAVFVEKELRFVTPFEAKAMLGLEQELLTLSWVGNNLAKRKIVHITDAVPVRCVSTLTKIIVDGIREDLLPTQSVGLPKPIFDVTADGPPGIFWCPASRVKSGLRSLCFDNPEVKSTQFKPVVREFPLSKVNQFKGDASYFMINVSGSDNLVLSSSVVVSGFSEP